MFFKKSSKFSFRNKILIPLSIVAGVSFLVVGFLIFHLYTRHNKIYNASLIRRVYKDFQYHLELDKELLSALEDMIKRDHELTSLVKTENRMILLKKYRRLFEKLKRKYNITHFYFHNEHRKNILRVHVPERYGDTINRYTAIRAEQTRRLSSGIELGPLGTFTLRAVKPLFEGEKIIGYIELGKEIEDIFDVLTNQNTVEMVFFIPKNLLKRSDWERGMEMLGRNYKWDAHSHCVVIYSSLKKELPIDYETIRKALSKRRVLTLFDKRWFSEIIEINDVSGAPSGSVLFLNDVTDVRKKVQSLIYLDIFVLLLLYFILFVFFRSLLKNADKKINQQKNKLIKDLKEREQTLEKARLLQEALIQNTLPLCKELNIEALYMPCEALGGGFLSCNQKQ